MDEAFINCSFSHCNGLEYWFYRYVLLLNTASPCLLHIITIIFIAEIKPSDSKNRVIKFPAKIRYHTYTIPLIPLWTSCYFYPYKSGYIH